MVPWPALVITFILGVLTTLVVVRRLLVFCCVHSPNSTYKALKALINLIERELRRRKEADAARSKSNATRDKW